MVGRLCGFGEFGGNVVYESQENTITLTNSEVVIITKKEAEALVKFLSTQWLDRNIEELSNAMHRLQVSIKD